MSSNNQQVDIPDKHLDKTLRPDKWGDYIGQKNIMANLKILIAAASSRSEPPDHVLLYGGAGLGKTTLAHLIAKELGTEIKVTSGPAIERVGDLASILTNLTDGEVLFICPYCGTPASRSSFK